MTEQTPDDTDRAERAFRDALSRAADGFHPEPLTRPESPRRRWWRPALAAAAVLLVAGTLAAVTLPDRDGGGTGTGPGTATSSAPDTSATGGGSDPGPGDSIPKGWHYESHLDAVVGMPDSWDYRPAPDSQWCVDGGLPPPTAPYVDTNGPLTVSTDVLCAAQPAANFTGVPERFLATHLSFPDPATATPGVQTWHGWTQTTWQVGHAMVSVLADAEHAAVVQQIEALSAEVEGDFIGCPATSPIQSGGFVRPDRAFDVTALKRAEQIAVCQYLLGDPGQPGLIASRLLAGADAGSLLAAIQAAPVGGGPDTPDTCVHSESGSSGVALRFTTGSTTDEMYVYYETCIGNGFDDGTDLRALTPASCRPLWGGRVLNNFGSSESYQTCHDLRQAR